MESQEYKAWLERANHAQLPILGNCTIGRSDKNTIVLDSPKVSRRHAIVNVQNVGEFWLIDLGSSNGTFLNHRRVNQPVRLSDLDQVIVGDDVFTFRQPIEIQDDYRTTFVARTIREIENVPCWLLVADIENFTPLSQSLTSDRLAVVIGGWVAACKDRIEKYDGTIDKYLGDGFFAYWRNGTNTARQVADAMSALKEVQERKDPTFRIALHFGLVAIGGMPSMGEESLMGREVNFVFRMEKLASSLGVYRLLSGAAQIKLENFISANPLGGHELKGFEGEYEFSSC